MAARSNVTGFCGVGVLGLRVEVVLLRAIDRVA